MTTGGTEAGTSSIHAIAAAGPDQIHTGHELEWNSGGLKYVVLGHFLPSVLRYSWQYYNFLTAF